MDENFLREKIIKFKVREVSVETGLHRHTINSFVNQKRKPSQKTLNRLTAYISNQGAINYG